MKLLLMILAVVLFACGKDDNGSDNCYDCKVYRALSTQYDMYEKCTDRIDTMNFKDQNNNDLQFVCTPK